MTLNYSLTMLKSTIFKSITVALFMRRYFVGIFHYSNSVILGILNFCNRHVAKYFNIKIYVYKCKIIWQFAVIRSLTVVNVKKCKNKYRKIIPKIIYFTNEIYHRLYSNKSCYFHAARKRHFSMHTNFYNIGFSQDNQ